MHIIEGEGCPGTEPSEVKFMYFFLLVINLNVKRNTDGGFGASLLFRTGLDGNTLTINERRGVSDDSSDLDGLKLLPPKLPLLKLSSHCNKKFVSTLFLLVFGVFQ